MRPRYEEFIELTEHLMAGLAHIIDADDMARVDDVVHRIAVQLGERPQVWEGAANLGLMVTEQLVGDEGPWAQTPVEMQANVIITTVIIVRLFSHPMMKPILKGWEQEDRR